MMGNVTVALSEFLVSTYLFLRIYALYDKSRRLLMMGAIFMAITIAILAVILAGKDQKGAVTAGGCNIGSSPSTAVVLVNVANMASYFPLLRGSLARLSCNISTVMITRLMLNLNKMTDFGIMSSPSQISTVHFNPTSS
ncbi:hypothetical protein JR316_0006305 [Psilocybe cubensis]|uniref:Uncharacterized protein n=1 Tax=Psilocybe cubensis TaxID=181762 RepID=A0ACB8H1J4_PSICU|nr:hypothetical protein JR316_0006305 [Psilocybe cubensis]KAH9481778.1 hypothetical protein JR316_0006305 [Psilocybe cubensis]